MPRQSKNRKSNLDPVESVPFRAFTYLSVTATALSTPSIQAINVSPAIDSRLNAISEVFQFYRFSSVRVHSLPTKASGDVLSTVGYIPRVPNTAPTTHEEIIQLPASSIKSFSQTVKSTMNIGRDVLLADAPIKWFQCQAGTEDTQWEIQGVIYVAGTATANPSNSLFIIEGVCEFKGRSNSGQTPLFLVNPTNMRMGRVGLDGTKPMHGSADDAKAKEEESDAVVIAGVTYYRSKA